MRIEESNRDEWMTPRPVFEVLCHAAGFEPILDVATSARNNLERKHYFTAADNALEKDWSSPWWCNPPYSDVEAFVRKAIVSSQPGIMLVPANRTDQRWFHLALPHASKGWSRGRVRFEPPEGITASSPSFGNLVLIFGRQLSDFTWEVPR